MVSERLKQLRSGNSEIRISAVESFFNSELDLEAVDALCSLVSDQDKGVRNALLLLFSNNDNPNVPFKLVHFVKSKELSVKNFAGELLLRIGPPAADAMLDFLDEGDSDDKKFIIDLLGLIRDRKSINKILKILHAAEDDNIELACIEALGNICEVYEHGSSADESIQHAKGELFQETSENIINSLIECYSKNELFKATIIESLGKAGQTLKELTRNKILEFVQSKYDFEDELTRLSIIECLGKMGDEFSFRFLLQKLKDAKGFLSWEIVKSISLLKEKLCIGLISNKNIVDAILDTIVEGDCEYKLAAVNILPSIESKEVMVQCLKLLNGCADINDLLKTKFIEKPELLYEASAELLDSGEVEKKPVLMIFQDLWKNSEEERVKFKLSPGRMKPINSLVNCLESPDEEVRIAAAELLFTIDNNNSVYFLEDFTEDPNMWNRLKAIDMLERIFHPKSDKILDRFTLDKEEMVSKKARSIIKKRSSAI